MVTHQDLFLWDRNVTCHWRRHVSVECPKLSVCVQRNGNSCLEFDKNVRGQLTKWTGFDWISVMDLWPQSGFAPTHRVSCALLGSGPVTGSLAPRLIAEKCGIDSGCGWFTTRGLYLWPETSFESRAEPPINLWFVRTDRYRPWATFVCTENLQLDRNWAANIVGAMHLHLPFKELHSTLRHLWQVSPQQADCFTGKQSQPHLQWRKKFLIYRLVLTGIN